MTDASGRFWLCPSCRKHVPLRNERCVCGGSRPANAASVASASPSPRLSPQYRAGGSPQRSGAASRVTLVLGAILLLTAGIGAGLWFGRATPGRPGQVAAVGQELSTAGGPESPRPALLIPETVAPTLGPLAITETVNPDSLAPEDRETAQRLVAALNAGDDMTSTDVSASERLLLKYPDQAPVKQLFRAVSSSAAARADSRREFPESRALLEKAIAVLPDDLQLRRSYVGVLFRTRDWPAVEKAAADLLSRDGSIQEARQALALAQAGQGKDREALLSLYLALDVHDDPEVRTLREQVERRLWADSGCEDPADGQLRLPDAAREGEALARYEKFMALIANCSSAKRDGRIAHFRVTYQGQVHDCIAPIVVDLLEKVYSDLVAQLGHQLARPIPVVLLGNVEYLQVTGAPAWSGGSYDDNDATISIPVGGMEVLCRVGQATRHDEGVRRYFQAFGFNSMEDWVAWELRRLLVHETVHAFLDEATRGGAPRELHEGLAQHIANVLVRGGRDYTPGRRAIEEFEDLLRDLDARLQAGGVKEDERRRVATVVRDAWFEAARRRSAGQFRLPTSLVDNPQIEPGIRAILADWITFLAMRVSVAYWSDLSFGEFVVAQRGMGGIRDLLVAFRSEGQSANKAFEAVYGRDFDGMRREWAGKLRSDLGATQALR